MKWNRFFHEPTKTIFIPGDWNLIDDLTGMKVKASATTKEWDGFRSTKSQRRHEQDFLRSFPERIRTPFARPEQTDTFAESTSNMVLWQPLTSYTSSDTVIHNGIDYTANETHTSSSTFTADFTKWDIT